MSIIGGDLTAGVTTDMRKAFDEAYQQYLAEEKVKVAKNFVVHGACLLCDQGLRAGSLQIDGDNAPTVRIGNKMQAHIKHCEEEHVECFGECKIKEDAKESDVRCVYVKIGGMYWEDGHKLIYLNNDKEQKALLDSSYLTCQEGGEITILSNGQDGENKDLENFIQFINFINLMGFYRKDTDVKGNSYERRWNVEEYSELYNGLKQWGYLESKDQVTHFFTQMLAECGESTKPLENISDEEAKEKYGGVEWKGSGYLHLTWEENYEKFRKWLKSEMGIDDPLITEDGSEYVAENYAVLSAIWVWQENVMFNEYPHNAYQIIEEGGRKQEPEDTLLKSVTKSIHGGATKEERLDEYELVTDAYNQSFS